MDPTLPSFSTTGIDMTAGDTGVGGMTNAASAGTPAALKLAQGTNEDSTDRTNDVIAPNLTIQRPPSGPIYTPRLHTYHHRNSQPAKEIYYSPYAPTRTDSFGNLEGAPFHHERLYREFPWHSRATTSADVSHHNEKSPTRRGSTNVDGSDVDDDTFKIGSPVVWNSKKGKKGGRKATRRDDALEQDEERELFKGFEISVGDEPEQKPLKKTTTDVLSRDNGGRSTKKEHKRKAAEVLEEEEATQGVKKAKKERGSK